MKKIVMLIAVLFAGSLLLVACNDNSSENANDNENNAEEIGDSEQEDNIEDNNSEETPVSNQDSEQNEAENEQPDNNDSNEGALPEPIEIDEQVQHPEGVTFTLEKITFKEDHISVNFNAQNHTGFSTYLASSGSAQGSNLGGITLEDDTGYVYRYVADRDSHRIKLEEGEQVTGTISFAGEIQEDAKSLTLIFNPDAAGEGTSSMPKFTFEDIEIIR